MCTTEPPPDFFQNYARFILLFFKTIDFLKAVLICDSRACLFRVQYDFLVIPYSGMYIFQSLSPMKYHWCSTSKTV